MKIIHETFSSIKDVGLFKTIFKIIQKLLSVLNLFLKEKSLLVIGKIYSFFFNNFYIFNRTKCSDDKKILYCFYDLAKSPTTFDIVPFLLLADWERREKKLNALQIIIVPGSNEGFRSFENSSYNIENQRWRLRNILFSCCSLFEKTSVMICSHRNQAVSIFKNCARNIFPSDYSVAFPVERYMTIHLVNTFTSYDEFYGCRANPQALDYISKWISIKTNGKKPISISLRESQYEINRNSNIEAWSAFAARLNLQKYFPIIIRDVEAALSPIPESLKNICIFAEIPWNIELRAALYELCYINMFVNNGPAALAFANKKARMLDFKMITEGCGATTASFFKKMGLIPGTQPAFFSPFKKFVWEDDNLDIIEREFKLMCDKIENTKP